MSARFTRRDRVEAALGSLLLFVLGRIFGYMAALVMGALFFAGYVLGLIEGWHLARTARKERQP